MPEPATPVTTTSTPSGMSTSTSRRLCAVAPRISSVPAGVRTISLRAARSSRWRPVRVPLAEAPPQCPRSKRCRPPNRRRGRGRRRGRRSRSSRLVLHDEHRVALVPQPQQQVVHPLDVMGVQARRGLVEDVGDVGERGAEVADHLDALRLAARQRARRPVEREVTQPDLHERVERLPQRREQRRHRGLVDAADPFGQVADLHRARIGDVDPADPGRPGRLAEPGAAAFGQAVKVTARSTNARMCDCSAPRSLDSNDFWTLGISPS